MGRVRNSIVGRLTILAVAVVALSPHAYPQDREAPDSGQGGLVAAEALVDAFYSFDSRRLEDVLASATESLPSIVFYQGWAEGGHYRIVERMPCKWTGTNLVSCSITVEDDLMKALRLDFNVTDTFDITLSEGRIIAVRTRSNDLPVFSDAMNWVRTARPELIRAPCVGFFDGGPTPGKCVRAMVEGFSEYVESPDFPRD